MSNLFKYTKRVLTSVLAAAVVLTAIPSTAFGAELPDEDIVEAVEVQEAEVADEAAVEEEAAATDGTGNEEEVIIEGEEENPDQAKADVKVKLVTGNDVEILNPARINDGVGGTPLVAENSNATVTVDSDNGFSFVVAPFIADGKKLDATFVSDDTTKTFYDNYTSLHYDTNDTRWEKADDSAASAADMATAVEKVTSLSGKGYMVEDYAPVKGYKRVTITSALLKDVIAKYVDVNGVWAEAQGDTDPAVLKPSYNGRPTLTIEFKDAIAGTFTFNEPTTKPTANMLDPVTGPSRTVNWQAIAGEEGSGGTGSAGDGDEKGAISNITVAEGYAETNNIKNAKITMTIKDKDGKNVDGIAGLSKDDDSTELAEFPYTAKGATVIGPDKDAPQGDKVEETPVSSGTFVVKHVKAVPFMFDTKTNKLWVSQFIINEAYFNDYTVDVTFDFEKDAETEYTIEVDKMTNGVVKLADGTSVAKVEKSADVALPSKSKATGVPLLVTGLKDTFGVARTVSNVYYTIGTGTTKYELADTNASASVFESTIPLNTIKDNVKLYVETQETVTLEGTADFALYTKKGDAVVSGTTKVVSGEPFEFTIQPTAGKGVKKVTYIIGKTGSATDPTVTGDVYSTVNVNDGLKVTVTSETVEKLDVIRTANADVTKINTKGVADTIGTTDPPTTPGTDGADAAVYDQAYYFDVTLASGKIITGVTYTEGSSTTKIPATFVTGYKAYEGSGKNVSTWRTNVVKDNIKIDVTTADLATVVLDNDGAGTPSATIGKATVKAADGTEVKATPIYVDSTKDFKFTITSDESNIKVMEVSYDYGTTYGSHSTPWEPKATTATYTIPQADLAAGSKAVKIIAETEETIDPSKYSIEFKNKNATGTANEKGTEEGEQLVNTYDAKDKLTGQELNVTINESVRLEYDGAAYGGIVLKDNEGTGISPDDLKYKVNKIKDSEKVLVSDGGSIDKDGYVSSVDTLTGYAVGDDTITVEARRDDSGKINNTALYTKGIKVNVKSQFEGIHVNASSDAIDDGGATFGTGSDLAIWATDGRTGEDVQLEAAVDGVDHINWSFDPDISLKVGAKYGILSSGSLVPTKTADGVTVKASQGAAGATIKVQAKVYADVAEKKLIATVTKDLKIVEAADYVVMPSVAVKNSATYQNTTAIASNATLVKDHGEKLLSLEDSATGRQTATLSYKIYKRVEGATGPALNYNSSAAAVATALKDKDYEEVTSGISYDKEVILVDHNLKEVEDDTAYVTVEGTATPFTVKANTNGKKTYYNAANDFEAEAVIITPKVNGVSLTPWVYGFRVIDTIANGDVSFMLNGKAYAANGEYVKASDETTTDADADNGKVVVRTLSDTYLNKYANKKSVIMDFAKEYTTGVMLTKVSDDTLITLPTEADFTATNKDPRAVLVGWKVTTGTAADATTLTSAVGFKPGAEVITNGGTVFTAVWAPKYYLAAVTSGLDAYANVAVGGFYWNAASDTRGSAEKAALGSVVNGKKAETNEYLNVLDPKYDDGTTKTSTYKIYKTGATDAAIGVELDTALFAFTPYALKASDATIMVRPVNITSGYTLAYPSTTTDTGEITFTGTKIKGAAAGRSPAYVATLTDGATWEFPGARVTVTSAIGWKAAFKGSETAISSTADEDGNYSIVKPLDKLTLKKSQATAEAVPFIINQKATPDVHADDFLLTPYFGTVEYAVANTSIATVAKKSDGYTAQITPKATGNTTLTATLTDGAGKSFTATLPIVVDEDDVVFDITTKKNEAFAGGVVTGLGGNATGIEFYAAAYAKNDTAKATKLSGTWAVTAPDSKNKVAKSGTTEPANDGTDRQKFVFSSDDKDIDSDNVEIKFTYGTGSDAVTYTKAVPVTTHYELVLSGGDGFAKTDDKTFITVGGQRVLDAEKTAAAEVDIPAATKTIEITTANKKVSSSGAVTYEVDLSDYAIEQTEYVAGTGDVAVATELDFWFYDGCTTSSVSCTTPSTTGTSAGVYCLVGTAADTYKDKKIPLTDSTNPTKASICGTDDTVTGLYTNNKDVAFTKDVVKGLSASDIGDVSVGNGAITLWPDAVAATITRATPSVSTVTLDATEGNQYKEVELTVLPSGSTEALKVVTEDQGFFRFADGAMITSADPGWISAVGKYVSGAVKTDWTVAGEALTPNPGTSRTDVFTLGMGTSSTHPTAGFTTLHIYEVADADNKRELSTVTLYVNGLNYVDANTTNYIENGAIVKSEKRTVGTDTYVFDENGAMVTGDKVVTLKDGSKVVIIGGKLAKAGVRGIGDDSYLVDANGVVLSGWQDYSGNRYYADPANDNKLVNGLATVSGKDYYFKSYALAKASATANKYEQVVGTDYYTNAAGEVAKNGLFTVAGINRLFRENGKIVVYADSDVVGGKIKLGNLVYVIDPTTSEATPDKKMVDARLSWTVSWPKTWKNGDAVPTGHYEITYKFEGESTTQPAIVGPTVSAAQDPAVIGLGVKKVTFTFVAPAADLAGFFSDSKGTVALTDSGVKKTYTFNNSGTGVSGGIEINGFEEGQEFKFTGGAIKPPVEVWDNDLGEKLVLGVDYTLSYKNNTKITTDSSKMPTLTVVGKGNYAGKNVTRTFKIVNPIEGETGLTTTVKKVELGWTTTPVYNGEAWYPDTITVDGNVFQHSSGDTYTTEGTANYVFTFSGNVDAGTATVGVTGQDGKTKKKTFKINKVDLSKVPTANLEISPADAEWTVKGAVPATTVTYTPEGGSAITLVEGQDYTLKVNYADKKKNVADGNTVTITGKGANFSKKATSTETFAITPYTITDDNLLEVVAPAGAKVKSVKTTVVDKNGVKIDKKNFAAVNVYDSTSTLLAPTASLTAGQTYKVEVVAPPTGNIDGSASFEFIAAADMSKAKVTLSKDLKKNGVAYTGEAIDITNIQSGELIKNLFTTGDITVEYKNPSTKKYEKLTWDEDFEVVGYQNNVKKGTMTVFIRAKEESTKVSGVKNFKIKISAKTMKKAD